LTRAGYDHGSKEALTLMQGTLVFDIIHTQLALRTMEASNSTTANGIKAHFFFHQTKGNSSFRKKLV